MNDIDVLENIITEYNTQVEDYKFFTVPVRLDETDIEALENAIKSLKERQSDKERIKLLELENQAFENTKNSCPMMNTSGIWCDSKERIKELEKDTMPIQLVLDMLEDLEKRRDMQKDTKPITGYYSKRAMLKKLLKQSGFDYSKYKKGENYEDR